MTPPAAPVNSIQFNNAGAFGGSAALTFDGLNLVTLGDGTSGKIIGSAPAAAVSAGIELTVQGGPGGATSGNGGRVTLQGGVPIDGNGGQVRLLAGNAAGTNHVGGGIVLTAGNGIGTGLGGTITVTSGPGGANGNGGSITFSAGNGGATSGNGGAVSFVTGLPTDGDGGSFAMTARNGVGTNRNGGSISLTVGTATGSGVPGALLLANLNATGSSTATFLATNKPGSSTSVGPTQWIRYRIGANTFWSPLWAD